MGERVSKIMGFQCARIMRYVSKIKLDFQKESCMCALQQPRKTCKHVKPDPENLVFPFNSHLPSHSKQPTSLSS
jgi:hypothetical protein